MKLLVPLSFDWDEGNKEKNWERHKVHFREAEEIFANRPLEILRDKKHSQTEVRFIALGVTNMARKLFINFTVRSQKIRVISARDQSKKERGVYEKKG